VGGWALIVSPCPSRAIMGMCFSWYHEVLFTHSFNTSYVYLITNTIIVKTEKLKLTKQNWFSEKCLTILNVNRKTATYFLYILVSVPILVRLMKMIIQIKQAPKNKK